MSEKPVIFSVSDENFFKKIVLGSSMGMNECLAEQLHNIFDNNGTHMKIVGYDKDFNTIPYKADTKVHFLSWEDNCPESMKNPLGIMESLREKTQEQMNDGAGIFNFGEIAAIFNMAEWCMYFRAITDENTGHEFSIRLSGEDGKGLPGLYNRLTTEQEDIKNKLKIVIPEQGTLKIFKINQDKMRAAATEATAKNKQTACKKNKEESVTEIMFIIECISSMTNIDVEYDGVNIPGRVYIKDNIIVNPKHKYKVEIYGEYNTSKGCIEWYYPHRGSSSNYHPIKSGGNYPGPKKDIADLLGPAIPKDKITFDIKLEGELSLWPSKTHPEKINEAPGIRFNQMNGLGKFVTLFNEGQTKTFTNWCLLGKKTSESWNIHAPGRDSEYTLSLTLLKTKHKSEIVEQLGYFAVKSRNVDFYDSPQRVPLRFVINTLFDKLLKNYRDNTGITKTFVANRVTDIHGNWFERTGKGATLRDNCITMKEKQIEIPEQEVVKDDVTDDVKEVVTDDVKDVKGDKGVTDVKGDKEVVTDDVKDVKGVKGLGDLISNKLNGGTKPAIVREHRRGNVSGEDAKKALEQLTLYFDSKGCIPGKIYNAILDMEDEPS